MIEKLCVTTTKRQRHTVVKNSRIGLLCRLTKPKKIYSHDLYPLFSCAVDVRVGEHGDCVTSAILRKLIGHNDVAITDYPLCATNEAENSDSEISMITASREPTTMHNRYYSRIMASRIFGSE